MLSTSMSPKDYDVYAEHLFKLGKGYPLWQPEPTKFGEVQIGDVGFLWEGAFMRLFNALSKEGLPENVELLHLQDKLFHERQEAIPPGPLHSRTLQAVDVKFSAGGGNAVVGASGKCSFQCKHDQGAILILDHAARETKVLVGRQVTDYIKQNYRNWLEFAQSNDWGLDVNLEDIIFISGFMKTGSSWSMAAVTENGKSATLGFDAGAGGFTGITAEVKRAKSVNVSVAQRKWPGTTAPKTQPTFDHCIFLRFCKVKRRPLGWISVYEASAGPHTLPPPDRNGDRDNQVPHLQDDSEIEEVPSSSKPYDPVAYVLDYILEESDAELALASDAGLYAACPDGIPDDIGLYLREKKPGLYVTKSSVGLLLCEPDIEDLVAQDDALATMAEENPTDVEVAEAGTGTMENVTENVEEGSIELSHIEQPRVQQPDQPPEELGKKEHTEGLIVEGTMSLTTMYSVVAFSSNDKYLVAGGIDGSILVWEVGTARCVMTCLPEDGGSIITTNERGAVRTRFRGPSSLQSVNALAFSPDSDSPVFVSGSDGGQAVWWDVATKQWEIIGEGVHDSDIRNVQWSPDGKMIATICTDSKIRLWDSSSLALIQDIKGGNNSLSQPLAFSPDSSHIASTNSNFSIQVCNVRTGQSVAQLKGHEGLVWALAFDPAGRRLVTGSEDGTAQIWNVETSEQLMNLGEMGGAVWHVEFTPDGKHVCVGLMDGTAALFDSFSGSKVCTIEGNDARDSSVASQPQALLSPDGTKVAVAVGSQIMIYDSMTGQRLCRVEHDDNICGEMRFSHDGKHVAAVAEDGGLRAWALNMVDNQLRGDVTVLNMRI